RSEIALRPDRPGNRSDPHAHRDTHRRHERDQAGYCGERRAGCRKRTNRQRTATNDISKSGGKIASKAKKVRNEIKGSIERMLESEASAGAAIDTFGG